MSAGPTSSPGAPDAALVARLVEARGALHDRIVAAGGSVGPGGVRVVAVTKTRPPEVVAAAVAAGFDELGENYAQELVSKWDAAPDARWHFIGGLQTNKVRSLVGRVSCLQSVDRPSLVREVAARMATVEVLVQVNLSGEAHRAGVDPGAAPALIETCRDTGLNLVGVMGVAPVAADPVVAAAFRRLRRLADDEGLPVVSMGMSDDLELAIAEGSTMVRVGSTLFGPRT